MANNTLAPISFGGLAGPTEPFCLPRSMHEILGCEDRSCEALPKQMTVPIQGAATADERKRILDAMSAIRASDPMFERYFDFVVSYLPGFNILVVAKGDPLADRVFMAYGRSNSAQFNMVTHTFLLLQSAITSDQFLNTLRHEIRHAYWVAIQDYALNSAERNPHCYDGSKPAEIKRVKTAIEQGNKRVEALKKQLTAELKQQLGPKDKKNLSRLRKACEPTLSLYHLSHFLPFGPATLRSLRLGLIARSAIGDYEVLSISSNPPGARIKILDPLQYFVVVMDDITRMFQDWYPPETHIYEFEAHLYGSVPVPLILAYYPELVGYTKEFEQRIMSHPHPMGSSSSVLPFANAQDFVHVEHIRRIFTDISYLSLILSDKPAKQILDAISSVIDSLFFTRASEYKGIGFNEIRFTLDQLLQRGLNPADKAQVNLLLAKIANKENDGLGACRYYHRAFKQGARFSLRDSLDCLENLARDGNWGEAKIICQKALAKYERDYHSIPSYEVQERQRFHENYGRKLEEWHQRIHQKRSGK